MEDAVYNDLATSMRVRGSRLMIEILKTIASPEEAELLLALPGAPDQIAEKLNRSLDMVDEACRKLYRKGLILKSFKDGTLRYRAHKDIVMFRDATCH